MELQDLHLLWRYKNVVLKVPYMRHRNLLQTIVGLFLYFGPNGVNVLKTLEIEDKVREQGYGCDKSIFEKHNGDTFAELNENDFEERFGATSIVIKRTVTAENNA